MRLQQLWSTMWWSLLQAMEDASADWAVEAFQSWIRHARRYFHCCLFRENIACDVDEVLWPDRNWRQDAASFSFSLQYMQDYFRFSFSCSVWRTLYKSSCFCWDEATQYFRIKKTLYSCICVFYIWVWKHSSLQQTTVRAVCSVTLKMQKAYW